MFNLRKCALSCVVSDCYAWARCLVFNCYPKARCHMLCLIVMLVRAVLCCVRLLFSACCIVLCLIVALVRDLIVTLWRNVLSCV